MDCNPSDTLDGLASGNRSRHYQMSRFLSASAYPLQTRRASSETRLEVLQNRDILGELERKEPEVEGEPSREERQDVHHSGESVVSARRESMNTLTQDEEALKLEFEAYIQEHQDTELQIFPKLFKCLKSSHRYVQLVTYYIAVLVVGVPATIIWGCTSGLTVFARVWIWVPALKVFLFWVHSCSPAILRPAQVLCIPFVDICARKYRQIRVQTNLSGHGETPLVIKNV